MARRIMRSFKMDEISAVDSPAQKGARATIMKRDTNADTTKRAFVKGRFLSVVSERWRDAARGVIGKAEGTEISEILAAADQYESAWGIPEGRALLEKAHRDLDAAFGALWASTHDILTDGEGAETQNLLHKSFEEFKTHTQGLVPGDISEAIDRLVPPQKGDGDSMSKAIAKALGLAETATEAEITAALTKSQTDLAELQAKVEKSEAFEKLSGKHQAFCSGGGKMPKGGKDAFVAMTPAQRDAHMSANPMSDSDPDDVGKMLEKGDAFKTETGQILTKKDFGSDAGFAYAKSEAAKNAELRTTVAKQADDADIAKRTTLAKSDLELVGKPEDLGTMLHKVAKVDPQLADQVETVLKGAQKLIKEGAVFKEIGSGHRGTASATVAIAAKAADLRKADPKLSIAKSNTMARDQNPDLAKQEEDEQRKAA